jgi:hypothetical protein
MRTFQQYSIDEEVVAKRFFHSNKMISYIRAPVPLSCRRTMACTVIPCHVEKHVPGHCSAPSVTQSFWIHSALHWVVGWQIQCRQNCAVVEGIGVASFLDARSWPLLLALICLFAG